MDISPRTAIFAAAELLKRGMPYLLLEKFGQSKPLPGNKSTTIKFRRYEHLPLTLSPLIEGVTPASQKLTYTDVVATLEQLGNIVGISDVIADTHEDPVFQEAQTLIGEQAAMTIETYRFNHLKAGSNVFYANNVAAKTSIVTTITRPDQRTIVRSLERQNAGHVTSIVRSTPAFNTENVLPCYVALCHSDLKSNIRGMDGFIDVKNYGTVSGWPSEIGGVEDVRYLTSTIFQPEADGGGAKGTMISTSGTLADIYPVLFIGKDSYGLVALKGRYAITPIVINPTPSKSDQLGQRGFVAWKSMQTAVILNDAWFAVYFCTCTN
ncbi:MAG: N4-gp56 family major capsid protein [Deltaproteobacteria bacterium]|nr:N4-gp56 family major capsid protein [Deltaproteobacteria bacterium]